jgi:S1-C subfamily serine protease
VYENVNRSVVNITTESAATDRLFFLELPPSKGEGSGSILTKEGHVLTNYHVIDGAREIDVHLWDGKSYPAHLVGGDPASDVAVLKIEAPAETLFPLTIGDSTRLRVGQKVYAIGNPFGFERTMSSGIISSLNRTLPGKRTNRSLRQMIQIDASINPGNSGGPLLDSHGRMIGMNTAIASLSGESIGLGFAIPSSTISRVVPELLRGGHVRRPEMGIAKVYQTDHGLLIASLVPGGPAEKSGLRGPRITLQRKRQGPFVYEYQTVDKSAADLIIAVDGQPTKTADDFLTQIETKQPGIQVVITVIRAGQQVNVPVVLGTGEGE